MATDWVLETLKELRDDVKGIQKSVTSLEATSAVQTASLEEHMRRTDALEKRVDGLWMKVLAVVGGLVGIASGLVRILGHG